MHMTKKTAVRLKTDILNSMLRIFSMNAQTRTIFQEESGFVYVIAVLVSLEGSLADPAIGCWGNGMLILLKSHLKYPYFLVLISLTRNACTIIMTNAFLF